VGVWEERAGRNEALFREVNENIASLDTRLSEDGSDSLPLICECARADCTTNFEISRAEYVRVRRHPHWFIVARGHEQPSIEHIVEQHHEYVIVDKRGVAAVAADGDA
jgi:hypothetical protein